MEWHLLAAAGSDRDLWVGPRTDVGNVFDNLKVPDGRDFWDALRADGPQRLGMNVWFAAKSDRKGACLHDMIWDTSASGVKIVSTRLADLLVAMDPSLRLGPVDLRDRDGEPIRGYVVAIDQIRKLSPVHSSHRTERGSEFVVSGEVKEAVQAGKFTGLRWFEAKTPQPGDEPLS